MFLTIFKCCENFKKYYQLIYKKFFIKENSSYWLNKIDKRIIEDYKLYHIV